MCRDKNGACWVVSVIFRVFGPNMIRDMCILGKTDANHNLIWVVWGCATTDNLNKLAIKDTDHGPITDGICLF